jgi:uncharacterized cofD-like protein
LKDLALVADKSPPFDAQTVRVEGESNIPEFPGSIRRVQLEPNDPPAYPEAIHAILNADMIVIGPGSLFTSLLPNLLIPEISAALRASRAFRAYVCNIATQVGETDGYDCRKHLEIIKAHIGGDLFDVVVANDCYEGELPEDISWVRFDAEGLSVPGYSADLKDEERPSHHDPVKLSETLISLLEERTGPLDMPPLDEIDKVSATN